MKKRDAHTVIIRCKTGSVIFNISEERSARLERIATLLKPTAQGSLSLSSAKELAKQLGVHCMTVYEYRRRLNNTAETIHAAIDGFEKSLTHCLLSGYLDPAVTSRLSRLNKIPRDEANRSVRCRTDMAGVRNQDC